jgi:hypothetical protein
MNTIIVKFDYSHLRNETHVEYNVTLAAKIAAHSPETLGIQTLFDKYKSAFDTETGGLDIIRKSEYTAEINEQDIVRDNIFRGLSDAVKSATRHFDSAKKQAADRLEIVLKNYGNIAAKTLDSETAAIDDIVRELADNFSGDVELLALADWVNQLENENATFKTLMEQRYDESAAKPSVIMKPAREETDKTLRALLNQIDALALVNGEQAYLPLIKDINAISERYKNLLARKTTKKEATV